MLVMMTPCRICIKSIKSMPFTLLVLYILGILRIDFDFTYNIMLLYVGLLTTNILMKNYV